MSGVSDNSERAVPADYTPLADIYETRWSAFNTATRRWVHTRWPEPLPDGARVADIGCGVGGLLAELAERHPDLSLVGLDITPALLARARREVPTALLVEGDAESPPFAADAFDVVCSLNLLHHMARPEAHVAALAQIARPGGAVFLCTFAGGHTWRMRLADWWLRRANAAWRGALAVEDLQAMLAAEPRLTITDQTQIKANAWWWLQIYCLHKSPAAGADAV